MRVRGEGAQRWNSEILSEALRADFEKIDLEIADFVSINRTYTLSVKKRSAESD